MVSRRNYITIAIMFLILFFMFQFTGVMKDQLNEYGVNEYEMKMQVDLGSQDTYDATAVHSADTPKVLYVGPQSADFREIVYWWCTYSKRAFSSCASLKECTFVKGAEPDMIVVDGLLVKTNADIELLTEWNERGIDIVFARMPEVSLVRESLSLEKLLGVYRVLQNEVQLTGMHLFKGFLLGGEAIYEAKNAEEEALRQDMAVTIPWYVTGAGTKTYMVGMISEEDYEQNMTDQLRAAYATMDEKAVENMILPAVIWRHGLAKASVFCVNGDFLSDISGIGILEAMVAEADSYDIYPVVNAQNYVVADFPAFTAENEEEMQRLYSQSTPAVYKEIIWPALTALNKRTKMKMTCMISPQFDYGDTMEPDGDNVAYYLKLLKEERGEAGLSGTSVAPMDIREKLALDEAFWQQYAPDYTFQSLYLRDSSQKATLSEKEKEEIKTLVINRENRVDPIVLFDESGMTLQSVTSNGYKHTFMDDFRLKSMETALAYSNITLDLYAVTYPESDDDSWEKLMKQISPNVSTYWKNFYAFEQTTLSDSDLRIRRFLALDYEQSRKEDTIFVDITNFDEQAWFILRLNQEELQSVKGGEYVLVEDGVYLIEAEKPELSIRVKPSSKLRYSGDNQQNGGGA